MATVATVVLGRNLSNSVKETVAGIAPEYRSLDSCTLSLSNKNPPPWAWSRGRDPEAGLMALYLMLSKLTERGRARVKSAPDRILEVNQEVEEKGAKVISQYALLGEFDFATVLEAPDNWNMLRLAMDLGARGTIETSTYPALRINDFISFMKAEPVEDHWREDAEAHPERDRKRR